MGNFLLLRNLIFFKLRIFLIFQKTQLSTCFTDCISRTVLDLGNYGYRNSDRTAVEDNNLRTISNDLWNVGDVIGIAINLDERNIEYFRNGVSLGIFFKDIAVGENKAYFPSVLLGYKQKIYINFGQERFFYSYHNYNSLDLPEGEFRNYFFVSKNLLDFMNVYYFKYVYEIKIPPTHICSLFSEIFLTLYNITLEDEYSIREAFIPFLLKIDELSRMDDFLKTIYLTSKYVKKYEIFTRLVNCKD